VNAPTTVVCTIVIDSGWLGSACCHNAFP
jgi:hypothetical protein